MKFFIFVIKTKVCLPRFDALSSDFFCPQPDEDKILTASAFSDLREGKGAGRTEAFFLGGADSDELKGLGRP